jgi:hypothetical protein
VKEGDSNLFRRDQLSDVCCSSAEFQRQKVTLIRFIASFFFCLQRFGILDGKKRRRLMTVKIKKKVTGSHSGLARWTGSRVDRVSPAQFPSGFLPKPGLVPGPGRPGPRSTCRTGPGFKTLIQIYYTYVKKLKYMFMS